MVTFSPTFKTKVDLALPAELDFLPVAASFVENAASAFGLGKADALDLTLSAEEIFAYLCRVLSRSNKVQMHCTGSGYFVELGFLFDLIDFDMKVFNLTANDPAQVSAESDETGLLIASRMVDGFRFFQKRSFLALILKKEKSYPLVPDLPSGEIRVLDSFSMRPPDPDELKLLVLYARQCYPSQMLHPSFAHPGQVVDMVSSGDFFAAIAVDDSGHIGGGILGRWEGIGNRVVEFSGPYVFEQRPDLEMGQALVDYCIEAVARTHAVGIMIRYPTPQLPVEYFDSVGSLTLRSVPEGPSVVTAYFRLLGEDPGLVIQTHPAVAPFLSEIYRRLSLPRELIMVEEAGESSSSWSVLSAELNRNLSCATLRPVWEGKDSQANVSSHVETLRLEGYRDILFEIDMGRSWHSSFVPAILACGFTPRLILPYGGKGDLLIFQYAAIE